MFFLLWVIVSNRPRVCKIYISSRELEAILLNRNKKNGKTKPWCEWKRISLMYALLIYSSRSFSYEYVNLPSFRRNDFYFFLLLIKLFRHSNPSILRISSHFKWELLINAKKWGGSLCWLVWDKWDIIIFIGREI